MALNYYFSVAPVYTAVEMLSQEASSIQLAVESASVDASTEKFTFEHPALDLLSSPNADATQTEFFRQMCSFYLLTGNVFMVATGPVNRPPLEIQVVNPTTVTLMAGSDGFLDIITVTTSTSTNMVFTRQDVDGRFRYFTQDGNAEIWHIKTFSPRYLAGDLWGMSPLNSIYHELEQYAEASVHNLSLLKRGARPSGALKFNDVMTDQQLQRLQQQADSLHTGGNNAGRLLLLEGADFVEMSQSNKDMDFAKLKQDITNTIYNALRIPLPLINSEFSTYDNMSTSTINFYDQAVIPLLQRLLEELSLFLMPRFDKTGKLQLSFDPETVEALTSRAVDQVLKIQATGVLTVNEMRHMLGYDPIEGGDFIYMNSTLVPMGEGQTDPDLMNALIGNSEPSGGR